MKAIIIVTIALSIQACTVVYNQPAPNEVATDRARDASNSQKTARRVPSTISESIALCNAVQKDEDIPVACSTDYIQGNPVMAIGFPNEPAFNAYLETVAEYVIGPFCGSANQGNREAFVLVTMHDEDLGKFYLCETGTEGDWFQLANLQN